MIPFDRIPLNAVILVPTWQDAEAVRGRCYGASRTDIVVSELGDIKRSAGHRDFVVLHQHKDDFTAVQQDKIRRWCVETNTSLLELGA